MGFNKKKELAEKEARKLTGKELFMTDKTLDKSDLKFLEDGMTLNFRRFKKTVYHMTSKFRLMIKKILKSFFAVFYFKKTESIMFLKTFKNIQIDSQNS